jgi:hypothetical protein
MGKRQCSNKTIILYHSDTFRGMPGLPKSAIVTIQPNFLLSFSSLEIGVAKVGWEPKIDES